jgi:hypothetical protein
LFCLRFQRRRKGNDSDSAGNPADLENRNCGIRESPRWARNRRGQDDERRYSNPGMI